MSKYTSYKITAEHFKKNSFNKEEVIVMGESDSLLEQELPPLPRNEMLMISEFTDVQKTGGQYDKGYVDAFLDITPDLWFFDCHFKNDPVMPGCLGVDALWQALGFYLTWNGARGTARALGVGEVKFSGQILRTVKKVYYHLDIKKLVLKNTFALCVADGTVARDGRVIYSCKNLKVGTFKGDISQKL